MGRDDRFERICPWLFRRNMFCRQETVEIRTQDAGRRDLFQLPKRSSTTSSSRQNSAISWMRPSRLTNRV